ncbi:MAG: DegT/DnrJ/EryC1/StrS family aminotransferase [Gemmatimonadales bacterium]|nr:DegT/DnrJ/EryC1/StrS family aminotransferase [Gemmatimonadales bacterium]
MRPELPPLEKYVELLRDIWDSRLLSNFGKYAQLFESRAQRQVGTPRVRSVANADIGLVIALAALDLPEGGEAIVPSFTFNSTVNAIVWNRLTPVFADIDPATFNLDPAEVERLIGPRTVVVAGTHVFGNPCDADAIRAAARGLPVVYDAAHAFGSRYRGRAVGTLGDLEVFSFSGTKLVTSAEGGLVAASRDDLVRRVEYLRAYGFQGDYESHLVGVNGKISELNAALGALTVEMVEAAVDKRHALAAGYREQLGEVAEAGFQLVDPRDRSTHKDFAIVCRRDRDGLERRLAAAEIQTKRYFRPAHTMRAYARYARDPLPRTEDLYRRILCLPIFNELPLEDVGLIAGLVREHFRAG